MLRYAKFIHIFLIFVAIIFVGCNSRKNFKPEVIAGNASFNGKLEKPMVMSNSVSAKLKNNEVITSFGRLILEDSQNLIYIDSTHALVARGCSALEIFDIKHSNGVLQKQLKDSIALESCLVSASIKDDLIAGVSGDNTIFLYNLDSKDYVMKERGEVIYAIYSSVANPVFLDTVVIFPTLDGRLNTIDLKSFKSVRNVIVNTDKFLNNIIYLKVIKDSLVSATQKRIYTLVAGESYSKDLEIRDLYFDGDYIYVLALDGTIYQFDKTLGIVRSVKLTFAILNGILIKDNFLYTFDSSGKFLVKLSLKDFSYEVFKVRFGGNGSSKNILVFYTDRILYINKRLFDLDGDLKIKRKATKAKG